MFIFGTKSRMVEPEKALPGRADPIPTSTTHDVLGTPLKPPFPEHLQTAVVGMGCYWGAERTFWQTPGVYTTAVGFAGGFTPNPTYEEVCTAKTGHTEAVLVVFDPEQISYEEILKATKATFEERLKAAGYGAVTTEIAPLDTFYYESDDVHQQYLAKVPNGYCGLGGTGVSCPIGLNA